MNNHARFVKGVLGVCALFALVFGVEFLLEWTRLGRPGLAAMGWADANNAKLVDVLSPMARAYNNVLAMLLATIGLAIPLTANMHTPKLIDMFLRDRLNRLMLGACALSAANVLWWDYLIGPHFAPVWAYRVAVYGALLGWAVLIPYFFYVVRFLHPSNILARLKGEVEHAVDGVTDEVASIEAAQQVVHERLHQIGTIILKSVDRADRGVVLEGIWSLKRILDRYGERKALLPARWFVVDRKDFVGLAAEALELVNEERTFFEMKVLTQMYLAYQVALAKATDAISSISDATRVVATGAAQRGDVRALELAVKFFNNYLREAIKRKDTHAVYDLFYQYRVLGRDVREHPAVLRQIGRNFRTYCGLAIANGMSQVPQLAGFDLGWLVRRAYEAGSPVATDLLEDLIALDDLEGGQPRLLLVEAKAIVGGALLESRLEEPAARLRDALRKVPADVLAAAETDLMGLHERSFREVTDRQVNFQWVSPERRPFVCRFLASVRAPAEAPPVAAA